MAERLIPALVPAVIIVGGVVSALKASVGAPLTPQLALVFVLAVVLFAAYGAFVVIAVAERLEEIQSNLASGLGWLVLGIVNIGIVFIVLPTVVVALWGWLDCGPLGGLQIDRPIALLTGLQRVLYRAVEPLGLGAVASTILTGLLNLATLVGGVSGAVYLAEVLKKRR